MRCVVSCLFPQIAVCATLYLLSLCILDVFVFAAPSVPRNVSAAAVNATTLKVTWTLPASYVETINEYRVCLTHATSSGRDSVQCYTKTELYQKQILTYNEVCCVCVCYVAL